MGVGKKVWSEDVSVEKKNVELDIWRNETKDGIWRRRSDIELKELYEHGNIEYYTKAQRLWWLGYAIRISKHRYSRRALQEVERGEKA